MTGISFLSIIYEETKPETFEGVDFRAGNGEKHRLPAREGDAKAKDATVIYLAAAMLIYHLEGEDAVITSSSTVDHFVMDGGSLRDGGSAKEDGSIDEHTEEDLEAARAIARAFMDDHPELKPAA